MPRIRFAIVAVLLVGCGVSLATQPTERPQAAPFSVAVGTTVHVLGTDLTIELARVTQDSRCPVEVNCVSAGDAAVVLFVRDRRAEARDVTLHTRLTPREVVAGTWRVHLVDLAPQPSLERPLAQKDYVATLRVDAVK